MKRNGFTLIELLVAMGILAIISAIGLTSFASSQVKAKDASRKNDLAQIARGLEAYNNDWGSYPASDNGTIVGCYFSGQINDCKWLDGTTVFKMSSKYRDPSGPDESIIYLGKLPNDPDQPTRSYRYDKTAEGGFNLYAAIDNQQDKDIKQSGGKADPAGWGVDCGSLKCNYKLTELGVVRQ